MFVFVFANSPAIMRLRKGIGSASLFVFFLVGIIWSISILDDFYLNFFVKFLLIQIYVAAIYLSFSAGVVRREDLAFTCRFIIYLHAAFFLAQFLYFLATKQYLDFNNYVREVESESLYMTKALEGQSIGIRATGLFSEPSFYGMVVLCPATLLIAMDRRLSLAALLAFITAFLSLSVAVIIVGAMIIGVFLFFGRSPLWVRIVIIFAMLAIAPYLWDFYQVRVVDASDYDAVASRQLVFDVLARRGWGSKLFGTGFFWDESKQLLGTSLRGYHVRDSSFFVYLYFASGVVGCLLFSCAILYIFRRRWIELFLFLPLLLFKFHILFGMFWFLIIAFWAVCQWHRYRPRDGSHLAGPADRNAVHWSRM